MIKMLRINKLRKHRRITILFSFLAIGILNGSFKAPLIKNNRPSPLSKDTIAKQQIPLYADSSLYSGYLGNLAAVRNQILDSRHIDKLLKSPVPVHYTLTESDKKNYVLSIDQSSIKNLHDTIIFGERCYITRLAVKFTNSAGDTLKYLSMDCSWLDSYFTSNRKIGFEKQICYKNEPIVGMIPPHSSTMVTIPIVFKQGESNFNRKFRIGISLQKFITKSQLFDFDAFVNMLRPETSNMIWSNEVELPVN